MMDDILYEFISLKVRCPLCENSLMDSEQLVDGHPGIRLEIETNGEKGTIILSPIYESYNYRCDIEIPDGEIVKFYCPHCSEQITSSIECEYCDATMVPLTLDIGGKAIICSRSGCKSHFLEFEDINAALKKLYYQHEFQGNLPEISEENGELKEIIESGTYLPVYCPFCNKTLIHDGFVKIKILNDKNEAGYIFLSPYLNVFTSRSTVFLKEDQAVNDLICPHCNSSLIDKDEQCGLCGSPAAKIAVSAQTKLIDFYICSKKGCRWHGMNDDDLHDIELEDSLEW